MRILHTESSPGLGGQEIRILRESEGMRARGHEVILAVQKGGGLVMLAKEAGFCCYELSFAKKDAWVTFFRLLSIMCKHRIDLVNTHSSFDAWLAGFLAKILRKKVIRTRHLSTPIRSGMNSRLLYNCLADAVVTTCEEVAETLQKQANLSKERCRSIPTGVAPFTVSPEQILAYRASLGIGEEDCLVGTLCVLRGWKGVSDLLKAAAILREEKRLFWLVVGAGASEEYFKREWQEMQLQDKVLFTGHLSPPHVALASMDIFALLSHSHEGVSQASLQAAWLKKPLILTPTGGLKEVCLHEKTGLQVGIYSPLEVANAVRKLLQDKKLRATLGENAHQLVLQKFTDVEMLDQMERLYRSLQIAKDGK